jgi:putative aldouronate transport system substrate-binding protein
LTKKLVKVLALVLAVAILASVSLAAKKEVPKPKKIVAFLDTISIKESGQDEFVKEYKKFTGIDLEIIQPVHNQYYEKLRLAFAAGEIPDVVEVKPIM